MTGSLRRRSGPRRTRGAGVLALVVLITTFVAPAAWAVDPPRITVDLPDRVTANGGAVEMLAEASNGPGDITTEKSTDGGATWSPISIGEDVLFTAHIEFTAHV